MSFNQIIILSAVFEARNQRTYCAFVACEVSCHEQALSHALQEEYILIRPGHAKPVCGVLSYRAFSAFSVLRRARKWHTYATFGLWTIPIGSSLSKTQKNTHMHFDSPWTCKTTLRSPLLSFLQRLLKNGHGASTRRMLLKK